MSAEKQLELSISQSSMLPISLNKDSSKSEKQQTSVHIPSYSIIHTLGLKNLMFDKFVFKRRQKKYQIKRIKNSNYIVGEQIYRPYGFAVQVQILQHKKSRVPVSKIKPMGCEISTVIIYAHGNSMDMVDSLKAVEKVSEQLNVQFVVFDYTGYGCSVSEESNHIISQETIQDDLQIVIAWLSKTIKLEDIIIWGFSLGTFPVCYCAAKYSIKGAILQSPIASLARMFKHEPVNSNSSIKNDYLVNLDYIHNINCPILIVHSRDDTIIPFQHSLALFHKYKNYSKNNKMIFIEVDKINHNQMSMFFYTKLDNQLKKTLFKFIKDVCNSKINKSQFYEEKSQFENVEKLRKQKLGIKVISSHFKQKYKETQLQFLAEQIKIAIIEQYNDQSQQLEVVNGNIIKRPGIKMTGCFCKKRC